MGENMEPSVQVTLSAGDLLLTAGVRYVPEPFNLSTLLIEGAAKHPQSTLIAEKDAWEMVTFVGDAEEAPISYNS